MKETWKPVVGYEGIYEVSDLGRVKSVERKWTNRQAIKPEQMMKPRRNFGYECVQLSKDGKVKNSRVHRLLATAFIENPENKTFVNHKNGIKHDNRLENLEWVTASENTVHSFENGFSSRKPRAAKLKAEQVLEIRKMFEGNKPDREEVAKTYGVSVSCIKALLLRNTWKDI